MVEVDEPGSHAAERGEVLRLRGSNDDGHAEDLAPGGRRAYCKGMQPPGFSYRPDFLSQVEEAEHAQGAEKAFAAGSRIVSSGRSSPSILTITLPSWSSSVTTDE